PVRFDFNFAKEFFAQQKPVEFEGSLVMLACMRRKIFFLLFAFIAAMTTSATAATTRIIKVLPHFIDHKGRHSLSPSLYDRDAYQAHLRANPELRSGLRFDVHWKAKTAQHENLTLRVELRGAAEGNLPRQTTLETTVKSG